MRAYLKTRNLQLELERIGARISFDDAEILRRAALVLHRWHEQECGDSNEYMAWAIERDNDGVPYMVTYPHSGKTRRYRIPDREAGAIKRIKAVCARNSLNYFVQTDPRGLPLYVSRDPISDNNYHHAFGIGG